MTRILAIAEAANPEWVSVPLVGWSLANALRDVADVHLVTQVRNREAILRAGLVEHEDVTFIDTERLSRPVWQLSKLLRMGKGKGWTIGTALGALSYPYFEHLIWRRFGADIEAGRFDLVHRITPLTPTAVSPIAKKCARAGVPFILGPLNGGVPWPKGFDAERRREHEWLSYVRGAYKVLPGRRRMFQSTSAIFAGSRHTLDEIPNEFHEKTFWLPENAVDLGRFTTARRPTDRADRGPLRICFIGRLVPYKGPDMLLEAAAPMIREGSVLIDVIGDGPMRDALQRQVSDDGLAEGVTFHGMLPHRDVQNIASKCSVMAFPSIREFGGGAVLEAMAMGVVPIVVDYGGPGELVDAEVGFKIPLGSRSDVIAGFRKRLSAIVAGPDILPPMAQAGRSRVEKYFTWSAKALQVSQVYRWVLSGAKGERPAPIPSSFE